MKVLFNAQSLLPPRTGIGLYTQHLLEEMLRQPQVEAVAGFLGGRVFQGLSLSLQLQQGQVVNTRLGNGVNELAAHDVCALTVEPSDAGALAGALNRVLGDPLLARRLGEAGRQRVQRDFTVEAMVRKTLDLYASLARPRAAVKTLW